MRLRPDHYRRSGATLVEGALVISTALLLVIAMLDLGMGVMRHNTLSHATRYLARQAIVHGSLSSSPWGPSTYGPVAANDSGAIATAVQAQLLGFDPAEVTVTVTWPDGYNDADQNFRVQVTLTSTYQPILTSLFGSSGITLQARSTMIIAH
jgi:Flp pilus assembly protein TadG